MSARPTMIRVSGPSESGKTSLICDLIPELKRRGYRVGAIKHDVHDVWRWDDPEKDTGRVNRAGADAVGIVSPGRCGLYQQGVEERDVEELAAALRPTPDVVLLEGFSSRDFPGLDAREGGWVDEEGREYGDGEISAMVDGIESRLPGENFEVQLTVNGESVPLKDFPRRALAGVVEGFVRSLSGVEEPGSLRLRIDRGEER